jgi:amino acid adenylation domain-containing protein
MLPTSYAQQGLWFIDQYEPGSSLYNIQAAWRLRGELDVHALQRALHEIVRRHETLRTSVFVDDHQNLRQIILPFLEVAITHTDLSATENFQAKLLSLLKAAAHLPFDLSEGPLLRCGLIRLNQREYVLLITMHHIVSDGWSMGVLTQELGALYAAFSEGRASPLAELPVQYADYAHWQREWLQNKSLQPQIDFWRKALEGAPPLVDLPLDRARPAQISHRGASAFFELDPSSTSALRRLCQQARVTAFMALAALLNVLLHRYSRQNDICIGYPVAGRQREELEGLIGFFVNTLVLRTHIDPRQSFQQLLEHVRESVLDANDHQDLPFEKLVEELNPERSLSHSPLFQVMLAFNNATGERLVLPGLEVTPLEPGESATAKFDLTFDLTEAGDCLLGVIEYKTDLFDRSTIERMARHLKTLLQAVVTDPQKRIQDLPFLTETERHRILEGSNDKRVETLKDKCVHHLFEDQVERTPDAVAVIFRDQQLTYTQLNACANQLAHYLKELGVSPDTFVAICVERSLEMVVGLMGILKAGGAYVPLDPDYPKERLEFMLKDTNALALLTQQRLRDTLPLQASHVVCLDRQWQVTACYSTANPVTVVSGLNLAYCIYTSGSTGKPKGSLNTHSGFTNLTHWYCGAQVGHHAGDRTLLASSVSFDLTQKNLLATLAGGGAVVIPDGPVSDDVALAEAIRKHAPTRVNCAPSAFRAFESAFRASSVRSVVLGGEQIDTALVDLIQSLGAVLINSYGPTECADVAVAYRHPENTVVDTIPMGQSIPGVHVYLLDENFETVPKGVQGEIFIAGVGVGRGYLNECAMTAERFLPDPFGSAGTRMYKTGDLGRWERDGNLVFLGRRDHQVKINGYRIELGEIEMVLKRVNGVRDAVVLALEDNSSHKTLVGYVVFEASANRLSNRDLNEAARKTLPHFMVPQNWVVMEKMPLNPNGKVDRGALPRPRENQQDAASAKPQGQLELIVSTEFERALGLEQPGRTANFFALGGHSLLAVQLASRLRAVTGKDVRPRDVFRNPTVAGLAESIALISSSVNGGVNPIDKAQVTPEGQRIVPASFAQVFRYRRVLSNPSIPGTIFVDVPLSTADRPLLHSACIAALNTITQRHAVLRSFFHESEGDVWQIDNPTATIPLEVIRSDDLKESKAALKSAVAGRRFEFGKAPLAAAWLICADDDSALVLAIDHILVDYRSCEILRREVGALVIAHIEDQPPPNLPFIKTPFPEYAITERIMLSEVQREKSHVFWSDLLAGLPISLPTGGKIRPAKFSYTGLSKTYSLQEDLSHSLRAASSRTGLSAYALLHAAALLTVACMFDVTDVFLHTTVSLMDRAELEQTVGYLSSTVLTRIRLEHAQSLDRYAIAVGELLLGVMEHAQFPNQTIYAIAGEKIDHSYGSRMQFSHTHIVIESKGADGLAEQEMGETLTHSAQDLSLQTTVRGLELGLTVTWNQPLFDKLIADKVVTIYTRALEKVISGMDTVGTVLSLGC